MNKRLKQYISTRNLSVRAFEMSIDTSNGVIRRFVDGETSIKSETIIRILETYPDLSAEWLLRGKGEMMLSERNSLDATIAALVRRIEQLAIENQQLKALENDKR